MVGGFQLAQFNVARAKAPLDDPAMAGFVEGLARINALAESAPGFLWRLQDSAGDATGIRAFDDPRIIVNLSVWADVASLSDFTYRSGHREFLAGRRAWFEPMPGPHLVLWWIPAGQWPDAAEARARLDLLSADGPGPGAFTFKNHFTAAGAAADGKERHAVTD